MNIPILGQSTQVVDTVTLEPADWEFDGHNLVDAKPGTWQKRLDWMDRRIGASYCCPACQAIRHLVFPHHQVDHEGRVTPAVQCRTHAEDTSCSFLRKLVLKNWLKKPLYCVIAMRRTGTGLKAKWKRDEIYVHASNQEEAAFQAQVCPPDHILSIGPVFGIFDKDGKGKTGVLEEKKIDEKPELIRSFGGFGGGKR